MTDVCFWLCKIDNSIVDLIIMTRRESREKIRRGWNKWTHSITGRHRKGFFPLEYQITVINDDFLIPTKWFYPTLYNVYALWIFSGVYCRRSRRSSHSGPPEGCQDSSATWKNCSCRRSWCVWQHRCVGNPWVFAF